MVYDLVSIQQKGMRASTNYNYRARDIVAILTIGDLMEIKTINADNQLPMQE